VSNKSQVRSTYFHLIQVRVIDACCAAEAIGLRVVAREVHRVLSSKENVSPLMSFTATGCSTAHTKCHNEVEDLERSAKLCGRAVADNEQHEGKLFVT